MSSKTSLSGSLEFLGFVDLLQLLGSNGSSGVLRLQSKYAPAPGVVYFSNGNPIDAANASKKGLEALFSFFGWVEGEFNFNKDTIERKKIIKNSRMEVILDGLKKLDDGIVEKLGPETLVKTVTDKSGGSSLPLIKGPLIDYNYVVDEEEFYEGSKIVEEGKHGNWIWVILDGMVDIVKETPDGPFTVVKIGAGAFIGGMASFLLDGHVRSASAVAAGKVQLGVLDSQRIASEYARMSSSLKDLLRTLDNRLTLVTNSIVDIHLKKDRLSEFVNEKKQIIKQGAKEERLFEITDGNAYLVRTTDNEQIALAELGPGDYYGHFPFLDLGHEPYSASVYGTENIEVRELDVESIQKEYEKLSSTFRNIIENITTSISVTTMLACEQKKKNKKK